MLKAKERAEQFLSQERQFHLGVLWTEQPHPRTVHFGQTIRKDTEQGLRMLLEVDQDIPPVAERVLLSPVYEELTQAFVESARNGRQICLSGCGASGRVAIILEAMWRTFWQEAAGRFPSERERYAHLADRVISIMTGGDRALIRSIEHFEDYQAFGRRQVIDAGLGPGDVLVAMAEEGVTSSVLGSAHELCERGGQVFMVFNNPRDLLVRHIERSRELVENDRIVKLELTTGHMALSGSTRLQATSIAMLILGAALEEAAATLAAEAQPRMLETIQAVPIGDIRRRYASLFQDLLNQLSSDEALAGLSRFVDLEHRIYSNQGLVTYIAERYLLDIFSDTTERTPTFMIPPFHPYDDPQALEPWAFAKDPLRPSREAWDRMLGRRPRGLAWTKAEYEAMGAQEEIVRNPPVIDREQIYKFQIGHEDYAARYEHVPAALVWVTFDEEPARLWPYFEQQKQRYTDAAVVAFGSTPSILPGVEVLPIPLDLPATCCWLFQHLAVKLSFNAMSTGTMGKLGRIHGNWMIQVDATNKKLIDRSIRMIANLAQITYAEACYEFFETAQDPAVHRLQFRESYVVQTLRRLHVDLSE